MVNAVRLLVRGGCIASLLKIGRSYDPVKWTCATCVADYFGFELPETGEWEPHFLTWVLRRFKRNKIGDRWGDHIGEMVSMRYTRGGGLHIGVVLSQGVYHAYRVPGRNGGDTVITAFNMMSGFHDIRFYRYTG